MDIMQTVSLLTSEAGISGEEHVMNKAIELLSEYCEVTTDSLGSIIGTAGSGSTHLMLDAHLDRIGLIVTAVDKSGFLRIDRCGGCDVRVLAAAEVTVWGKEAVFGVITSTPPHLADDDDSKKAADLDKIYIDTGLSYEQISKIVSVGDRVTIDSPVTALANGKITGSALDDRIGMAAILRALEIIKDKPLNIKLSVIFSAQEETTEAGGKTGSFAIAPDEAVAVDVSFAAAPDVPEKNAGKMGNGAMICISPSLSREMTDRLFELAEKNNIPHQAEICPSSTGTNADVISISASGVKTSLISIPIRNMHTQAELADIADIEAVAQLIAEYIMSKGENKNA